MEKETGEGPYRTPPTREVTPEELKLFYVCLAYRKDKKINGRSVGDIGMIDIWVLARDGAIARNLSMERNHLREVDLWGSTVISKEDFDFSKADYTEGKS